MGADRLANYAARRNAKRIADAAPRSSRLQAAGSSQFSQAPNCALRAGGAVRVPQQLKQGRKLAKAPSQHIPPSRSPQAPSWGARLRLAPRPGGGGPAKARCALSCPLSAASDAHAQLRPTALGQGVHVASLRGQALLQLIAQAPRCLLQRPLLLPIP